MQATPKLRLPISTMVILPIAFDWISSYVTHQRGARLITGGES
jgi:hypothetical protein